MRPSTRWRGRDAPAVARQLHRWGHAVLRQGAASGPWDALDVLLGRLDELLHPLSPGAPPGQFAALSGAEVPDMARVLLKCLVKTIVCNSPEASSLALSPRLTEIAQRYLGSDEVFFENGSLRLHLCRDRLEVLDFHVDNAQGSQQPMLNGWLPMSRVLPGQEIRMVSLSHRIGARGRQLFETLPAQLKWWISSGRNDYERGDVHLWSGDTEHGRVLNRHREAAIAMVFRYAARPLNSDWRRVAPSDAGEHAGGPDGDRALDGLIATLIPEAVELIRSTPRFAPIDGLRLLQSAHLASHPGIARQLALCLIYYYDRAGLGRRVVDDPGGAPARVCWPEYAIEMYLLVARCYLQEGMADRALGILAEVVRHTPVEEPLYDRVAKHGPALVAAMTERTDTAPLAERGAGSTAPRAPSRT